MSSPLAHSLHKSLSSLPKVVTTEHKWCLIWHWWDSGPWNLPWSHIHLLWHCHSASTHDQVKNKSAGSALLWLDFLPEFLVIAPSHLDQHWDICSAEHCSILSSALPCPQVFRCSSVIGLCSTVSCDNALSIPQLILVCLSIITCPPPILPSYSPPLFLLLYNFFSQSNMV